MATLASKTTALHALIPPTLAAGPGLPRTRLLWLKTNLRLDDNAALLESCGAAADRGECLLPLLCLDSAAMTARTRWGGRKVWRFPRKKYLFQ